MLSREEIVQQALALSPDDRVFVAESLDRSLIGDGFATTEVAAQWLVEVERRAAAFDRGELPAEDWQTVMTRLRNRSGNATSKD